MNINHSKKVLFLYLNFKQNNNLFLSQWFLTTQHSRQKEKTKKTNTCIICHKLQYFHFFINKNGNEAPQKKGVL
jgi:hypothetical protein